MNKQTKYSKKDKHIFVVDDEYLSDTGNKNINEISNSNKKGGVYCIDFNKEKSKKIGIPSLDENDEIQYNVKIGRCKDWKTGRKQNYDDMNVFSQPPRLLFFCETDDEVKMEAFFHKSFKNATLNDPIRRELFKVDSFINTKTKLTKTFTKIMKESKIPAYDKTDEQRINEKEDIFANNIFDNFKIAKGCEPNSNQHILKRINTFKKLNMTIKDFKNKKHTEELYGMGNSPNKPTGYKKQDLCYDIKKGYLKLVCPSTKIIEHNKKLI
jgi:hypothetical protein